MPIYYKLILKRSPLLTLLVCFAAGTIMIDPTLGNINLACARWPAFNKGKQLPLCVPCMKQNIITKGAGKSEQALMSDITYLSNLPIEIADIALIGRSWTDREETSITFTLLEIKWVLLDSSDGTNLPTLVGYYATSSYVPATDMEWSTIEEIRIWISSSKVTGALTDREARALHRAALAKNALDNSLQLHPKLCIQLVKLTWKEEGKEKKKRKKNHPKLIF
jgi:hypothetical protein